MPKSRHKLNTMEDYLSMPEEELELREHDDPTPAKPKRKRKPSAAAPPTHTGMESHPRRTTGKPAPSEDLPGLAMLAVSTVLLLALFSADSRDLPSSAWLNPADQHNTVPVNCIGILGAYFAFYSHVAVGLSIYLLPLCLAWFGICKIVSQAHLGLRTLCSVPVLLFTGACLLDVSGLQLTEQALSPAGAGGAVGHYFGGKLFANFLGQVGTMLLFGSIYTTSAIFITGMRPLEVLRSVCDELPELLRSISQRLRTKSTAHLSPEDLAPPPEPELPPAPTSSRSKKASTTITPSSIGSSTATEPPVAAIIGEQLELPMPQIIDSSAPKLPERDETKPPLSEVWARKRQAKQAQSGEAPRGSLTEKFKDYLLPPLDLLHWPEPDKVVQTDPKELIYIQETIIHCLASFGITVSKGDITRGPAITRYEVKPVDGLRVSRIAGLDMDIARATKAERINILAPIPGKDTVGIELANRNKVVVPIRELLEDDIFQNGKSKLPIALGKDVYGTTIIADLAAMPHLLVAGATGSGKSVCINGIITSLLARFAPDELRFVMIDPKVVEMQVYAEVPHLALPVVTDPKKALLALRWVVKEMEARYQIFASEGVRNFESFNNRNRNKKSASRKAPAPPVAAEAPPWEDTAEPKPTTEDFLDANGDWTGDAFPPDRAHRSTEPVIPDSMPFIVVIIDELADLMQTAPADIEQCIARITQMARAAGIHLIIATQTPRADVITGVIKANVPSRIAFQVASAIDSRVILDRKGAENLVGKGDMLYLPPGTSTLVRSQGALVTDDEIHAMVEYCAQQGTPLFDAAGESMAGVSSFGEEEEGEEEIGEEDMQVLQQCIEVIRVEKKASTSLFQRRLGIGYGKAARMMDILEDRGIIGPADGQKLREILVSVD